MSNKNLRYDTLYKSIKADICSGRLLPGHRVDMAALGSKYGASPSPVRNVLNRLVGEGLLEPHPNEGFYRPVVTEQIVREQYRWNQAVVLMVLDDVEGNAPSLSFSPLAVTQEDPVLAIEDVFAALAGLGNNTKAVVEITASNDHLRALRRQKDPSLFDRKGEIAAFIAAWSAHDLSAIRQQVIAYHDRRLAVVPQIVASAYRATPPAFI